MSGHALKVWKHSIAVTPPMPSLRPALKATLCLGIPLVTLALIGRLDWAMYAGFGAFCAVFGRYDKDASRFWQQLSCAAVQLSAMLLATLVSFLDAPFLVRVLVLALIGGGANLISRGMRWMPPGPVFAVFAGGACISIPATASSFVGIALVGGGAALFSILFMLGLAARRGHLFTALKAEFIWAPPPKAISESLLMAAGVLAGGLVGQMLGGGHWYWASLGAIAGVTGISAHSRVARALQRSAGTCAGVVLTGVLFAFNPNVWILLVAALIGQMLIEMVILRNYAVGMIFMTCSALIMVHMVSPEPSLDLLIDRMAMTALGAGIGAVLSILVGVFLAQRGKPVTS